LIKLFGFTLLRNGVKYDYSFRESLLSLEPIVEKTFLALDPGEDSSADAVQKISSVKIIPSKWDMTLAKGLVLSVETNKALSALRAEHGDDENAWGLYLQADEVLHEDDYEILKRDIEEANRTGCDVVSFRYLHFWQNHHQLAIAKNWYPQEIRAVKLKSNVVSYGDAQSFSSHNKTFFTEARIYHYGHVRDQNVYKKKMEDMSKLYDADATKSKYYNQKDREKDYTDCIPYYGTHPLVMKERILRMGDVWELPVVEEIFLVGEKKNYSEKVLKTIAAKKVHWMINESRVKPGMIVVDLHPGLLKKLLGYSKVPAKMKSKHAHLWSAEFRFILQLSEKEIGFTRDLL
jgi:hypothetical protein